MASELAALTPAQRPAVTSAVSPLQELRDLDAVLAEALTDMVRGAAALDGSSSRCRRQRPSPSPERCGVHYLRCPAMSVQSEPAVSISKQRGKTPQRPAPAPPAAATTTVCFALAAWPTRSKASNRRRRQRLRIGCSRSGARHSRANRACSTSMLIHAHIVTDERIIGFLPRRRRCRLCNALCTFCRL